MSYIKDMGYLKTNSSGIPEYTLAKTIPWVTTEEPYPVMTRISTNATKNIRRQWIVDQDGFIGGTEGVAAYSVNGIWVGEGGDTINGHLYIFVKKGDVFGTSAASRQGRDLIFAPLTSGSTEQQVVTNMGAPDYAKAGSPIVLNSSTPYTVQTNGYVSITMEYENTASLECNGVPIGVAFYSHGNFAYAQVAFVPVSKGDVITLSNGSASIQFIPPQQ